MKKSNTMKEAIIALLSTLLLWIILSKLDAFEVLLEYLEKYENYELDELLLLLIIMGIVSIIFSVRRVAEAVKYNQSIIDINSKLEKQVEIEVSKQREQEYILIQQSKLASMGEMIGNIAHQWRQPLNAIGLVAQNIKFMNETDSLDDKSVERSINKIENLTQSMSKTIDDFRNFYNPNKNLEICDFSNSLKDVFHLIDVVLSSKGIKINDYTSQEIKVIGYSNELSQVILNIVNNAKDALLDNNIRNPEITFKTMKDDKYGCISIEDNGGGIQKSTLEKIFNPYFTTKEEGKGTGIGLYMSKVMIEKNMDGSLIASNTNRGALFKILLPLKPE